MSSSARLIFTIYKRFTMPMPKGITVIFCLFLIILAAERCAYLKKDVVAPPCTLPDSVSYKIDIEPVISGNCYSCHSTASNISGILLDSYDRLKAYAQSGQLYGAISHSPG